MKARTLALIAALTAPVVARAQPARDQDKSPTAPGAGDKPKPGRLADDDVRIVSHYHHFNQMEIDLGKRAKRVGGPAIKKYGDMLVTDHTAADKQLVGFAKQHGLTLIPLEMPQNDIAKQALQDSLDAMSRLKQLDGAAFDRELITTEITDHDKEVGRIAVDMVAARNVQLADVLRNIKPVLRRHGDAARELQRGQPTASANRANPRSRGAPPGTR